MFSFNRRDERTDHERYLEDELEREREDRRREEERQEEQREQRKKEREEQWRYEERRADSWPEAFQKQAYLCWREQNQFPDDTDKYFERSAQANEKALEIWKEVAASRQAQLDELQKQIEVVWDSIRNEVADRLIAVNDCNEYAGTANAIRENALKGYLDW